MASLMRGSPMKAIVEARLGLVVVDPESHCNKELYLFEVGSAQPGFRGIGLHPDGFGVEDDSIEVDFMINIRQTRGSILHHVEGVFNEGANMLKWYFTQFVMATSSDKNNKL